MGKAYLVGRTGVYANERILIDGQIVLGRDSNVSHLIYPPETQMISGMHCKIQQINDVICLTDLESTNGTFLMDGTRLEPNMPRPIGDGQGFYLVNRENAFDIQIESVMKSEDDTLLEENKSKSSEPRNHKEENVQNYKKESERVLDTEMKTGNPRIMYEQKEEKSEKRLRCPKCGSTNCQIIQETTTKGKDFSAGKGCCGAILLGPIGILCGACGKGKRIKTNNYWVCTYCGNKFKV